MGAASELWFALALLVTAPRKPAASSVLLVLAPAVVLDSTALLLGPVACMSSTVLLSAAFPGDVSMGAKSAEKVEILRYTSVTEDVLLRLVLVSCQTGKVPPLGMRGLSVTVVIATELAVSLALEEVDMAAASGAACGVTSTGQSASVQDVSMLVVVAGAW